MYNEVWPCASWGSIEYGPPDQPGQLLGGRWRPLHYQLRSSIFADQLATCNTGGACFVTNSAPFAFKGEVSVRLLNVLSGKSAQLKGMIADLPPGAGVTEWFCASGLQESVAAKAIQSTTLPTTELRDHPVAKVPLRAAVTCGVGALLGCFNDTGCQGGACAHPVLPQYQAQLHDKVTLEACASAFNDLHLAVGGIDAGNHCFCGSFADLATASVRSQSRPLSECRVTPCHAAPAEKCGGTGRLLAFNFSCSASPPPPPPPPPPPVPPISPPPPPQLKCLAWANTAAWKAAGCDGTGTNCVLDISVQNGSGTRVSHNVNPFVAPKHMAKSLPKAAVSFTVGASGAITLTTTATALYVVLTTAASGRFSDNAFLLEAGEPKVIEFVSWKPGGTDAMQLAVLKSSLRVEHLQENLGTSSGNPNIPG